MYLSKCSHFILFLLSVELHGSAFSSRKLLTSELESNCVTFCLQNIVSFHSKQAIANGYKLMKFKITLLQNDILFLKSNYNLYLLFSTQGQPSPSLHSYVLSLHIHVGLCQ